MPSTIRIVPPAPPKIAPWLAQVLRRELAGRGLMIAELAALAVVDRSYLGEILAEKRSPTIEVLERLTEALGMTLSALFAEAERLRGLSGK